MSAVRRMTLWSIRPALFSVLCIRGSSGSMAIPSDDISLEISASAVMASSMTNSDGSSQDSVPSSLALLSSDPPALDAPRESPLRCGLTAWAENSPLLTSS